MTFLQGKFSEKKVENYEDAIASIQQIAGLIGLGAGSEFFASFASEDDDGYTYYTFQQRYRGADYPKRYPESGSGQGGNYCGAVLLLYPQYRHCACS